MNHTRPLVVLGLLSLAGSNALAQPAGAQAETLFRKAKDLLAQGKTAEACAAFDASEKLDPNISTLLNQASCREKNNQLATAWGLFLEAERQTRAATDDAGKQLHQVAADHARKLEPRLSSLRISVPIESRTSGLEIHRDGELLDVGAWNQPLPLDGGTYKISAHAVGSSDWSSTVTIGSERDAKSIDIPKLVPATVAQTNPAGGTTTTPSPAIAKQRSSRLPFVFGGAAIVLAGGALGFELWSSSTYDKTKQGTDAQKLDQWHSANNKRYVAEAMGIAAIGCAGVAVWLYVRDRHSSPEEQVARGIVITPLVTNERAGLALTGSF